MTPARTASYGLGNPPPLYRWIDAVLMLFVELVHGAASTLKMIFNRKTRDWHTDDVEEALPHATSSISSKETHQAEAIGLPTGNGPQPVFPAKAGIQTPHKARLVHKLALFPLIPTNVGIQGRPRALFSLAASSPHPQHNRSWIPTLAGMNDSWCATSA